MRPVVELSPTPAVATMVLLVVLLQQEALGVLVLLAAAAYQVHSVEPGAAHWTP